MRSRYDVYNSSLCLQDAAIPRYLVYAAENAMDDVFIASPFVKKNALEVLFKEFDGPVTLLTRDRAEDFALGVSDLSVWPLIWNMGGHVFCLSSLHAKYYRFDETVFIGSANATDNGLQFSAAPNAEILVKMERTQATDAVEERLLEYAREASDDDFRRLAREVEVLRKNPAFKAMQQEMNHAMVTAEKKRILTSSQRCWLPATKEPERWYWDAYLHPAREDIPTETQIDLQSLGLPEGLKTHADFLSVLRGRIAQMNFKARIDEMFANNTYPEHPHLSYGTLSHESGLPWSHIREERSDEINGVMSLLCYAMPERYFNAEPQSHSRLLGRK